MSAPADDGCLGRLIAPPSKRASRTLWYETLLATSPAGPWLVVALTPSGEAFPCAGMRLDIRTPGPPVIWIAIIEVRHQLEPGHYDDGGDGLLLNPGGGTTPKLSITYLTIDTVMISPKAGARS